MIVTATEYEKRKFAFLKKHKDWDVETSPMDQYGCYRKTYTCTDGAIWYEVMRPVYETVTVEVKLVKIPVEIKLFETEGWSTESESIFYYEKF